MNKYLVVFEKTKTGYSAYVPDLPGCAVTAKTKIKAEKDIFTAITMHLESLHEDNVSIPAGNAESEVMVFQA